MNDDIYVDIHELIFKLQELLDDGHLVAGLTILEAFEIEEGVIQPTSLSISSVECGGRCATDYSSIDEVSQDIIDLIP